MTVTEDPRSAEARPAPARRWVPPWRNPWRRPYVLAAFTWLYILWSLLPVLIAVQFSFNDGRSRSTWQGFSTQWYCCAEGSVGEDPSLLLALKNSLILGCSDGSGGDATGRHARDGAHPMAFAEQQGGQRHRLGPARHAGDRGRLGALPRDGQPVPVRPAGSAGHAAGPRHVLGLVRARDRALETAGHRPGLRGGEPGTWAQARCRRSGRS